MFAQTETPIGTGTGSNTDWEQPCPFQDIQHSSRMQFLYLASELSAAGMTPGLITKLGFTVADLGMYVGPNSHIDKFTVKIGHTATASLSSTTWESGATTVIGPIQHLPVLGKNMFTFSTPFFWNGTDNVYIEICTDASETSSTIANPFVTWTTGLPFNGSHAIGDNWSGSYCDRETGSSLGSQTTRPNIIFEWSAASACESGTLTAGTAVASHSQVCSGESVSLKLDGASQNTGLSYQWQRSDNGTSGWTDIPGATKPAGTFTQTTTSYYRAIVTCAAAGTATSTSVQVGVPAPLSGTFTIDKTQPAGNGNFHSFNDAYNHIRCGINGPVVFNVAAGSGVYTESLSLLPVPGASKDNTITFNGNTGASIEFSATTTANRAVIRLDGADFFIFNNLTVTTSGSSYGIGFQLINDADTNIIRNCVINTNTSTSWGTNYGGVFIGGTVADPLAQVAASCDGNIVEGTTITGGTNGIILTGSSTEAAKFNRFIKNNILEFGEVGIRVSLSFNTVIDQNILSRPTRNNQSSALKGIALSQTNTGLSVTRNTISRIYPGTTGGTWDSFYGIHLDVSSGLSSLPNLIENNVIYNMNGGGHLYGIYSNSSNNVFMQHNTIVVDGPASSSEPGIISSGFYLSGGSGIVFKNNNISVTRGGPGSKTAIWFNNNQHEIQSDRNNLHVGSTTGIVNLGYMNGTYTRYLGDWQAATGQDAGSVAADPLFEDLAAGNLKPAQPALDNMGENLNVAEDILGVARAATPDPGAYEFSVPACTVPPTAGVASLSKTSVCVDLTVLLTVSGNTSGSSQRYQLESSLTETGTYTAVGAETSYPEFSFMATQSRYYRVKVTCGTQTAYTDPVFLTVFQAFPAQTYTIDKNQPASGTNFTSFAAAYSAMECGIAGPVVFDVVAGSGPYTERINFGKVKGASAVNTITFKGNGNTIRPTGASSAQRAVIKLNGASHFVFDDFIIDATGSTNYGYGVQLLDADTNVIRNSTILSSTTSTSATNFAGIVMSTSQEDPIESWGPEGISHGNLFENNTIRGGYYGITLVGKQPYDAFFNEFSNYNKVIGNKIQDFYQTGIYVTGSNYLTIENNELSRPSRSSVTTFNGVYFAGTTGSANVNANRIFTPFGVNPTSTSTFNGFFLEYTGSDVMMNWPIVFSNNLIYRIRSAGPQNGASMEGGINVKFYHNTISLDDVSNTSTSASTGFRMNNPNAGIEIRNNMVTITRGGAGTKTGLSVPNGDVVSLTVVDHNNYYINGAGGNNHIGYRNSNRTTLEEWKAILRVKEQHSTDINPLYADTAAGNFAPTILPVDNTGEGVGVTHDIAGNVRDVQTPDIGAYEFNASSCITGVRAGDAMIDPASGICMGTPVRLWLDRATVSGSQTTVWQSASSATGPWTNISEPLYNSIEFRTETTRNRFFRAYVTCMGISDTSTVVEVQLNGALPAGTYTIKPDGSGDYQTFNQAVAAMACGIAGPVTFVADPGVYREQVRIRRIPGADADNRVTFTSASTDAAAVKLSALATSANNYVLMLDSASYITFNGITIEADQAAQARAVVLFGTSSFDSLTNNIIVSATATATNTNQVGVFASATNNMQIVLSGNTIRNGSSGIYLEGTTLIKGQNLVISNNTVTGTFQYGIYTTYWQNVSIAANNVTLSGAGTTYGIYSRYHAGPFSMKENRVTIRNKSATAYGIYIANTDIPNEDRYNVEGNKVIASENNTATLYGIYFSAVSYAAALNNVVYLHTSNSTSYGLYNTNSRSARYHNNTVYNTSPTGTNNYAAYFTDNSDVGELRYRVDVRNNVFAHDGGGKALYINRYELFNSDFNLLYAKGSTLLQHGTTQIATLANWRTLADLDIHSISTSFKPALLTNQDLAPDLNAEEVWVMQGRGTQILNNDHGINGEQRATLLKQGVPDLGAYEFTPVSLPLAAVATPAAPAAGDRQYFMLGTDTVAAITWGSTVPSGVTVRRYTGTVPPDLAAGTDHMYFYTQVTPAAPGNYDFKIEQFYLDPWRGLIDNEQRIRLGRTEQSGEWKVDAQSSVNDVANIISQQALPFMDKFTGLTDATIAYPDADRGALTDEATKGTRFWVGFGQAYMTSYAGVEEFVAVLGGADQDATVTVRINGTEWAKTYHVPANTYVLSDPIPKTGVSSALLYTEGLSERGISIQSDVPINAYVRADNLRGSPITGSTLLYPVASYGYEYYTMSYRQDNMFNENGYSWFYVIADHDNTRVQIVPSSQTVGGRQAGVPFEVTLNKGEVYQVLGAIITQDMSQDVSGSYVRSLANSEGQCYPIAVFSGNGRAWVGCDKEYFMVLGGQYMIQQNIPVNAWGQEYLTAPAPVKSDPSTPQTFVYRVMVKDPSTEVRVNGNPLFNPVNNYYTFYSSTADVITADKPIMVTQYMPNDDFECGFSGGGSEMFTVVAAKNGIKKAVIPRMQRAIAGPANEILLTLIIPTEGVSSLRIDGSSDFSHTYPHQNKPGYSIVVKRWPAEDGISVVESDSSFTAILYGVGGINSYGFHMGYTLPNRIKSGIRNVYDSTGAFSVFNCLGTPFRHSVLLPAETNKITWKFSQVQHLSPAADLVQEDPVVDSTVVVDGETYYQYSIETPYVFSEEGTYVIPIEYVDSLVENCTNTVQKFISVKVVATPEAEIGLTHTGCLNEEALFTSVVTAVEGDDADKYKWDLGDGSNATTGEITRLYAQAGEYQVKLTALTKAGCIAEATRNVVIKDLARVVFATDTVKSCASAPLVLQVQDPKEGAVYNWYNAETGGDLVHTGTSLTVSDLSGTRDYFVEGVWNGCTSAPRVKVVAKTWPVIGVPVVNVDTLGTNMVRFNWAAVDNVTAYQVSLDGGNNWSAPSSGNAGLSHTITGLTGGTTVTILVRAMDPNQCADATSAEVSATTHPVELFAPNAFTPNGDGRNDVFRVEGYLIQSLKLHVFNQWGQKVFETSDLNAAWDGTHKGKLQPSGVYMYVADITLKDGTKTVKKGSVNLIR